MRVRPVRNECLSKRGCNHTLRMHNIYLFSTATMVGQTRLIITYYMYIFCLVFIMCCVGLRSDISIGQFALP
jgi:hypothetical protein